MRLNSVAAIRYSSSSGAASRRRAPTARDLAQLEPSLIGLEHRLDVGSTVTLPGPGRVP